MTRSFRLVCREAEIPLVEGLLEDQGFRFEPEPFSPWCRRLTCEPFPVGASVAARFGLLYIQDRSSMLPPLALSPQQGQAVLDMCASPGGKTSFLAQLVGQGGFVLGNEPSPDRLATLRQNLARMNLPQAVSCGYLGQDLPLAPGSVDTILLDPPCSGWGTAEKNPKVLSVWRPEKVEPLIALQRVLLAKAASLLAPGGRLLYSTCTTNPAENEEQALFAADTLGLELTPLAPFEGFSFHDPALPRAAGTLRVDGEISKAQGFYLALFVKPAERPPLGDDQDDAPSAPAASPALPGLAALPPLPADAGASWNGLPPGGAQVHKDKLHFLPARGAALLPARAVGQKLGALKAGRFKPWARARLLLPESPGAGCLVLEDPRAVTALLSGQSIAFDAPGANMAGLFYRDLPLGYLTLKNGRALWSDR